MSALSCSLWLHYIGFLRSAVGSLSTVCLLFVFHGGPIGARGVMAPTYTQRVQENHVYASTVLYCVAAAALGGAAAAVLPL